MWSVYRILQDFFLYTYFDILCELCERVSIIYILVFTQNLKQLKRPGDLNPSTKKLEPFLWTANPVFLQSPGCCFLCRDSWHSRALLIFSPADISNPRVSCKCFRILRYYLWPCRDARPPPLSPNPHVSHLLVTLRHAGCSIWVISVK